MIGEPFCAFRLRCLERVGGWSLHVEPIFCRRLLDTTSYIFDPTCLPATQSLSDANPVAAIWRFTLCYSFREYWCHQRVVVECGDRASK
jgi:hypothetical protein